MVVWDRLLSLRDGNGTSKNVGLRKFWQDLENYLGNVFDKSWSLVSAWFVFTFFESRNFLPESLGVEFLTRISVPRRVSDFTIRHPFLRVWMGLTDNWQIVPKIYVTTDICLGFYWQMAKDLYFLQQPFMRLFNSIFPLFSWDDVIKCAFIMVYMANLSSRML